MDFKLFKDYRTVEKPPKYREKIDIEASFYDIQIKRQQLKQVPYIPPDGIKTTFVRMQVNYKNFRF